MITQNLPHELLDIILDHLYDDKKTLSACTLVCRALLDSSRYHLFRSMTLTLRYPSPDLSPGLDPPLDPKALQELPPHVSQYARNLCIQGPGYSHTLKYSALVHLVRHFPGLQSLILRRICMVSVGDHGTLEVLSTSVRRLELRNVQLDGPYGLYCLLSSYPAVSTLVFSLVFCTVGLDPHHRDIPEHNETSEVNIARVHRRLKISARCFMWLSNLITALHGIPSAKGLEELRLLDIRRVDREAVIGLLRDYGDNLSLLELDLTFCGGEGEHWNQFNLQHCKSLHTFILHIGVNNDLDLAGTYFPATFTSCWLVVSIIVSRLPTSVQNITFAFSSAQTPDDAFNDLRRQLETDTYWFDAMRALRGLPNLRTLTLRRAPSMYSVSLPVLPSHLQLIVNKQLSDMAHILRFE